MGQANRAQHAPTEATALSRSGSARHAWLALAALLFLFELPSVWLAQAPRLSGEPFVLLSVWLMSLRLRRGAVLRTAVLLATLLSVLVVLDRAGFRRFMGEEPLLYDQLFMLRHLFVLVGDLWSAQVLALLVALLLAIGLGALGVKILLRSAAALTDPSRLRRTFSVCGAVLVCVLIGTFVPPGAASAVSWTTPELIDNLARSRTIYRAVRRGLRHSPYSAYSKIRLRRRPDVYLILFESYGRIVAERPSLRTAWTQRVTGMETRLRKAGWSAVSGFSQAPVMGGRSWLAEGTLLMGRRVRYEAVFRQLVADVGRVPSLGAFLGAQGYQRVLLAPADRERSGVEDIEYYRYEQSLHFNDLGYRGPRIGWGLVPDQYSLEFADEQILRRVRRPLFFNFHMVSSHAPWQEVPELVDDWHALNVGLAAPTTAVDEPELAKRLKRYARGPRRFTHMGELSEQVAANYLQTILYDLAVLEDHLSRLKDDAIVIVVGDHQPPVVAAETRSFDTPMHVFARDPALLQEWSAHGFSPGMILGPDDKRAIRHEGLFSILVRALVRGGGTDEALPEYLPGGADTDGT